MILSEEKMGSNLGKLKKAVEKGDEAKVLDLYNKHSDIRRKLNANSVVNENTQDTYMHLSGKHGMIQFLKILLNENSGNPNKLNRRKQTTLHRICDGSKDHVQYECLKLLLQWQESNKHEDDSTSLKDDNDSIKTVAQQANLSKKAPGIVNEININCRDEFENTPLHYAAMKNLPTCVQTLIDHGAYLFVENRDRFTPCDLAEKNGHKEIALFLESKMLFSKEEDKEIDEEFDQEVNVVEEKLNFGLRIQDLQEEKDKLLVETSEMLRCNIFTAEILLKKHFWSKEKLMEAWIDDPLKCCEKCGISTSLVESTVHNNSKNSSTSTATTSKQHTQSRIKTFNESNSNVVIARKLSARRFSENKIDHNNNAKNKINNIIIDSENIAYNNLAYTENQIANQQTSINQENNYIQIDDKQSDNCQNVDLNDSLANSNFCNICFNSYTTFGPSSSSNEKARCELVKNLCGHKFCRACWKEYLTMKIHEGNVSDIICPEVDCSAIIPPEIVESLVSKETAEKYLQFDLKAFVDSNPSIKWCPFPGCGMAVKSPRVGNETTQESEQHNECFKSVDCGNGHYFCWNCLQEGHEPATCQNWKDWFQKIIEIKPEKMCNTNEKEELSANYLWLVTNSKNCPNHNCNAPIQKNEGCNHVKCSKCKHDFCWICLEPWKKHSSSTGGYFQCNRYEVSTKILQKEKMTIAEAEENHAKAVELNKFVHYYTRFKNHELSYKIEEPLLAMAKSKFEILTAQQNVIGLTDHCKLSESNQNISSVTMPTTSKDGVTLTTTTAILIPSKSKRFARNLSQSFEKNMSKLLTNDDWSVSSTKLKDNESLRSSESKVDEECKSRKNSIDLHSSTPSPQTRKKQTQQDECSSNANNSSTNINANDSHLFIEEAIKELLKARRILRCSYVYGYFLDTFGHRKFIFEYIQTEYEECTENLSQIIARPHLKTPKSKIIRLTNLLRKKRLEFLETITNGLNSFNDTPPALKKYSRQRWKYLLKDNIQNDDEFKNTIALSLKELNPKSPWIVDKKGRHTNLMALLNDWPELEQELDSILIPCKDKNNLCANVTCGKVRAVNTLSGSTCNYCSIKCMREDYNAYVHNKKSSVKHSRQESKPSIDRNESTKLHRTATPPSTSTSINKIRSKYSDLNVNKQDSMDSNGDDDYFLHTIPLAEPIQTDTKNNRAELTKQSTLNCMNNPTEVRSVDDSPLGPSDFNLNLNKSALTTRMPEKNKVFEPNDKMIENSDYLTILPFESIFLDSNKNNVNMILNNMNNVLYASKSKDKTCKSFNFPVKTK